MIDTLAIVSPPLEATQKDYIRARFGYVHKVAQDGLLEWETHSGFLEGSYDHRVHMRLVAYDGHDRLRIEGSIHKAIAGHNVMFGPTEVKPCVAWLVEKAGAALGTELPEWRRWRLHRVDVAEVYVLETPEQVLEVIRALQEAHIGRRRKVRYATSVVFPGARSTLKAYQKGPEFRKHDLPRLQKYRLNMTGEAPAPTLPGMEALEAVLLETWEALGRPDELGALSEFADHLLRVEVELKRKTLEAIFPPEAEADQIDEQWIRQVFWHEVSKVQVMGNERVNQAEAVQERLLNRFKRCKAEGLFLTWLRLATFGEEKAKSMIQASRFYEHKRLLKENGCDWIGSDVGEQGSRIPEGFTLAEGSDRRMPETESLDVMEALWRGEFLKEKILKKQQTSV